VCVCVLYAVLCRTVVHSDTHAHEQFTIDICTLRKGCGQIATIC